MYFLKFTSFILLGNFLRLALSELAPDSTSYSITLDPEEPTVKVYDAYIVKIQPYVDLDFHIYKLGGVEKFKLRDGSGGIINKFPLLNTYVGLFDLEIVNMLLHNDDVQFLSKYAKFRKGTV